MVKEKPNKIPHIIVYNVVNISIAITRDQELGLFHVDSIVSYNIMLFCIYIWSKESQIKYLTL